MARKVFTPLLETIWELLLPQAHLGHLLLKLIPDEARRFMGISLHTCPVSYAFVYYHSMVEMDWNGHVSPESFSI